MVFNSSLILFPNKDLGQFALAQNKSEESVQGKRKTGKQDNMNIVSLQEYVRIHSEMNA